jgi:hypothetical protein
MHRTASHHALRARRFLDAFMAAVHDLRLEQAGHEIVHFFDSDFLSRLIFGYTDSLNQALVQETKDRRPDSIAGQQLLMGALVGRGIGAPPSMRALLPHLYEVRRSVEGPRSHELSFNVKQAMADLGIVGTLRELQRALASDAGAEELFDRFVRQCPEIFYGTELLSGHWKTRLGRVLELGINRPGPFENAPEVVDTAAFDVLAREVAHRHDRPGGGGVNGLRDAMALATLAGAVADGPARCVARFYTETPRIHRAWRESAEMRAVLTYDGGSDGRPDAMHGEDGVLRTVEYYLIRALIPELGYTDRRVDVSEGDVSDVYQLADELTRTAEALLREGVRGSQLADLRIGSASLGEVMEEVSDLSLYGSAWRGLMERVPPGLPGQLVDQLDQVIAGERQRADELDEQFSMHVRALSERTRGVGDFTEAYAHLRETLTRWRGALRPRFGSYCAHVGLTRWGLVPSDNDEQELKRLIDAYADFGRDEGAHGEAPATGRAGFVIELAQRLCDMGVAPHREPRELPGCVAVLGFLSLVEDHASVVRYGADLLRAIETAAPGADDARWSRYGAVVEGLCSASEVAAEIARVRDPLRGDAADALVARTRRVEDRLERSAWMRVAGPEVRAIAQGYVLFAVWLSFNRTLMAEGWTTALKIRQRALLRDSLKVCSAALERCDPESPSYPLLLNHCVYVASMAKAIDDRIADLATKLMVIRPLARQTLSYRIDDTLGYYFYARAAMTLAEDPRRTESAAQDLREARRWLDHVPNAVAAPEVVAHRGLLRDLERRLGL